MGVLAGARVACVRVRFSWILRREGQRGDIWILRPMAAHMRYQRAKTQGHEPCYDASMRLLELAFEDRRAGECRRYGRNTIDLEGRYGTAWVSLYYTRCTNMISEIEKVCVAVRGG